MRLSDYKHSEPVFIDANIFLDYSLPNPKYGEAVTDFLEKVELSEISAVTTPVVLDEVSYILLMYKGHIVLDTKDRQKIRNSIKKDKKFAETCYKVVEEFNDYIDDLNGLKVIPVTREDYRKVMILGKKYRLLPSDALHASVMENNNIINIATRDSDFDRVEGMKVWNPEAGEA